MIVNRIWQQHFGRGLAANASDFGHLGELPTHPELLDWLAGRFVADGWSLKKLHKRIVMSATYRQAASRPDGDASRRLKDPENRFYWSAARSARLDAEQIRDSLYAVSGELNLHDDSGMPGAAGNEAAPAVRSSCGRCTAYPQPGARSVRRPAADRQCPIRAYATTTPVQSLLLINSQFMLKRAEAFAGRLGGEQASDDDSRRVRRAYELAFGRDPSADERVRAVEFLKSEAGKVSPVEASSPEAAFLADKIPFRDGQAAVVSAAQPPLAVNPQKAKKLALGDFTIEAYFVLRSASETAAVRTVASNWNGRTSQPGWLLGVTGKGSRRKPQTLVLDLVGKNAAGKLVEAAAFSDHHIQAQQTLLRRRRLSTGHRQDAGPRELFRERPFQRRRAAAHRRNDPRDRRRSLSNDLPLVIGGKRCRKKPTIASTA